MGKKLRSDMTPAERDKVRRMAKYAAARLTMGDPVKVPAGPVIAHVRFLREMGMPVTQIARLAGVETTTVRDFYRGFRPGSAQYPVKSTFKDTADAVLGVRYHEFTPSEHEWGGREDATGMMRRMQAMQAAGWSLNVLGTLLGVSEQRAFQLSRGANPRPLTRTVDMVRKMYDKYQHVDPGDYGISAHWVRRAKMAAARRGYAPPACWDDDTIDNPLAVPQWTGACGTAEGYRIHVRESLGGTWMPPCPPCREEVETRRVGPDPFVFRFERFGELMGGISVKAVADRLGTDDAALHRWRKGNYAPKFRSTVEALADAMRVDVTELLTEGQPGPKIKAVGEPGRFNPYALRIALDAAGITQAAAASLCRSSGSTMAHWLAGKFGPGDKSKLEPLAARLGTTVDLFYI